MKWNPILSEDSELGKRAWRVIASISEAVKQQCELPLSARVDSRGTRDAPLLFAYVALATQEPRWAECTISSLNSAIDDIAVVQHSPALFGGLGSLGWLIHHIRHRIKDTEETSGLETPSAEHVPESELTSDIDLMLLRELRSGSWESRPYDLISGLVGIGVYFLERGPESVARVGLALVLDRLEELAEQRSDGTTWYSRPALLPEWQRRLFPGGYYNLGVAHGVPGVLAFLGALRAAGHQPDRVHGMLESAMEWFLIQRRSCAKGEPWFDWATPANGGSIGLARMTWCYGDLGILGVLHQLTRDRRHRDWDETKSALLEHCLECSGADNGGLQDAGLCHGAGGSAHMFNRLFQETGDIRCRDAAVVWFHRALDLLRESGGVGGFFRVRRPTPESVPTWEASAAFLDGAIGLALALLSAVSAVEPEWDRTLLLSTREPPNST